jgi:hypothetical protein
MTLLATLRCFADHYQLYLVDGDYDHWSDPNLNWETGIKTANGNLVSRRAIYISTKADLNAHRIRIFNAQPSGSYDYQESHTLELSTGSLMLYGIADLPDERLQIPIAPGTHTITICARNLGIDQFSDGIDVPNRELDDDEFFAHDEFEHCDIYIQPS